jgi:methionyl aminopeptidase
LKQNQNKIFLKKEEEILKMIEGGKKLVEILFDLKEKAKIGVSSQKLDELAEKLILKAGGKSAFKGYKPFFAKKPFPATICFSKNQTVVHGIPKKDLKIEPSDIIK